VVPACAGISSTSIDMSGHYCVRKRPATEVSGTKTENRLVRPRQERQPPGDRDFIATGRRFYSDSGYVVPILSSTKDGDGQYVPKNVLASGSLFGGSSILWNGGFFPPVSKWVDTVKVDKSTQTEKEQVSFHPVCADKRAAEESWGKYWPAPSVASDEDTVRTHLAIGDRSSTALKARTRHHDAAAHWPPTAMQTADVKTSSIVHPVPSKTTWPECRTFPGMFKPGWHIGAYFRCHKKRGFHHRIYEGPPDGTERVRLGPNEIEVDFSRAFRVRALFCNETYSAVQFKVKNTLPDGSIRSLKVWTNIRKGGEWWADVVHASGTGSSTADASGRIGEAIVIAPKVRSVSCHRASPSAAVDWVD
jgi:TfoX/Sxy family transcriptional regulator of competence genes